jgi:DNA-binding NarL/FixJ family response regulator
MAAVLIVDDSPVTRTMIGEFLQMSGHSVAGEAENLAQALAVYDARKPDLVTLDLSMGQEDGFTVLKALRAKHPDAKVLIVSANTQMEIYDQLVAAGAAGFLTKPFSIGDLTAAAMKALAK